MQLRADALDAHLNKTLATVYVISSDEHLLALEAADHIRAAARKQGCTEREVLTVERGFKWPSLLAANQSQSLFGDRKLIELRMPEGKPGKEGAQALQEYVERHGNDNVSLITLPKLDWATQKSAWVACLQQHAVYIEIPLVERTALPGWIAQRLQVQGQSAPRQALEFIADRVEGNLLAAHQEVQKLALLYPGGELRPEQIQEAVLNVARYDVFKLNEAMLHGDPVRLKRMLDGLQGEGEALPLVLWAIAEEIRVLLKLKLVQQQGRPLAQAMKELRIWGPREKWMNAACNRLDVQRLQTALHAAAQVDKMIKGLQTKMFAGDPWDALLQVALRLI